MSDDKKDTETTPTATATVEAPAAPAPVVEAPKAPEIDPLALGKKFRREGEFVVDAGFDVTLTPAYKNLNNQFITASDKAKTERETLMGELDNLKGQLSTKKDLDADEKQKLLNDIEDAKTRLTIANREAQAAQTDLLKVQTAVSMGLPYNFVRYVQGETPEAIKASVEAVLTDFKLVSSKYTEEDLKAAVERTAAQTKTETEANLRQVGRNTESGSRHAHIYTRAEIGAMSLTEYKANHAAIQQQMSEGLIK